MSRIFSTDSREGRRDNSPALQRWDYVRHTRKPSPKRWLTPTRAPQPSLPGLGLWAAAVPKAEGLAILRPPFEKGPPDAEGICKSLS